MGKKIQQRLDDQNKQVDAMKPNTHELIEIIRPKSRQYTRYIQELRATQFISYLRLVSLSNINALIAAS